jgi:hypothetical protein
MSAGSLMHIKAAGRNRPAWRSRQGGIGLSRASAQVADALRSAVHATSGHESARGLACRLRQIVDAALLRVRKMRTKALSLFAVAFALMLSSSLACAFEGENLLLSLPDGYKVGFQKRQGNMQITEMVPKAETVEGWSEMVTVQVFHGLKATPDQFLDRIAAAWSKACAGAESAPIMSAVEAGYPVAMWVASCPLNKDTGKPELTFMKAIAGKDSFYVVQKAFKFAPSKEQTATWTQYLKKVAVCDTREAAHACPSGIK